MSCMQLESVSCITIICERVIVANVSAVPSVTRGARTPRREGVWGCRSALSTCPPTLITAWDHSTSNVTAKRSGRQITKQLMGDNDKYWSERQGHSFLSHSLFLQMVSISSKTSYTFNLHARASWDVDSTSVHLLHDFKLPMTPIINVHFSDP